MAKGDGWSRQQGSRHQLMRKEASRLLPHPHHALKTGPLLHQPAACGHGFRRGWVASVRKDLAAEIRRAKHPIPNREKHRVILAMFCRGKNAMMQTVIARRDHQAFTDTAKGQLRKLDKQAARRIVDFMDERIAGLENPRSTGKALTGPLGGFWRYRVGDCRVICDIQDGTLRVLVVQVGNRGEIYR